MMRSVSCFKQDRQPENVLTDGFATLGPGKDPVRDAIFSVGARNESRELSLMSALPVNAGTPGVPNAYGFSTTSSRASTAACHPSTNCSAFGRLEM
jgi:DNA-binding protein H-NS